MLINFEVEPGVSGLQEDAAAQALTLDKAGHPAGKL
jgi:hypothetical protein